MREIVSLVGQPISNCLVVKLFLIQRIQLLAKYANHRVKVVTRLYHFCLKISEANALPREFKNRLRLSRGV